MIRKFFPQNINGKKGNLIKQVFNLDRLSHFWQSWRTHPPLINNKVQQYLTSNLLFFDVE